MTQRPAQHALDLAMQRHRAGHLTEAERLYRKLLAREPQNAHALHMLGILSGQLRRHDAAIELIAQAIQISPDNAIFHSNLGDLYRRVGRANDAVVSCRQAIALDPNLADAHNNLGNALRAKGQLDDAIAAFRHALTLKPDSADIHNNLGSALRAKGRLDDAISAYHRAIALNPGMADAHNNLGNALKSKGQLDDAVAAYHQAIALNPNLPEAHHNLGNALKTKGQLDEAIAAYRQALLLNPNLPDAHANLANALQAAGRLDEAIAEYRKAIQLQPGAAVAHFNLGLTLQTIGRFDDALAEYGKAIRAKPDYLQAHGIMAIALATLQRFEEAKESCAKAAALSPNAPITHLARAEILLRQHDAAAAIEHFRNATAADPKLCSAWNGLGVALQTLGKFDEAAACFRRALEIRPDLAIGYQNLASTGRHVLDAADLDRLQALVLQPNLPAESRVSAEFALAKALDDADRFDEAFAHFTEANAQMKRLRAIAGEVYDPAAFHCHIDELIETFTPSFFEERRGWGDASDLPIFIVGMPRSGTSLVQQIAASHPQIHGAGELTDMACLANSPVGANARAAAMRWNPDSVKRAAATHLQRLAAMNPAASRVIDKQPENVLYLGLVALLFPNSRVILCRRDPRDTCLSCYFQGFSNGNTFSFDLAHCGHQHVEIDRLIVHWLRALPLKMLEVQYEALVADLEGQSRKLIDFLALPWDPACLQFHRAQNTVLTSSVWQVRQPIYTHSVDRWRHYQRHLGPLLKSLSKGVRSAYRISGPDPLTP